MSEPKLIYIPQLNPNEIEVRLASLPVYNGKAIKAGEALATFETTKSTCELIAESDGYVIGLSLSEGDSAYSGDVFCYLGTSPTDQPPQPAISGSRLQVSLSTSKTDRATLPDGLRISKPALLLAQQYSLDLAGLPRGPLVTEIQIRALLQATPLRPEALPDRPVQKPIDPTGLIIYGGGGHGKSLIDLVQCLGNYNLRGVIDDGLAKDTRILDFPVLGSGEVLEELASCGVHLAINAVGGIGNIRPRLNVFKRLEAAGFICPTVIHPKAFIEASATLSGGIQVFPFAYIGSSASLGYGVIANTGSIISHDCVIEAYANISPGAILAGGVKIGERSLIGMGVTINLGVTIGADVHIGNGATVKADVPSGSMVHAGSIWPLIA
jgi:acetyltransferase EpsM